MHYDTPRRRRSRPRSAHESRQFCVRVRDEGKGIDQEAIRNKPREGHFGWLGTRERAQIVGGRLEVCFKVRDGTRIDVNIPVAAAYVGFTGPSSIARRLAWAHLRHDRMNV